MVKAEDSKRFLKESIRSEQTLFDFLDANPKGNGQDALEYMTKRDISKKTATETIIEYGLEDFSMPPVDSMPTELPKPIIDDEKDEKDEKDDENTPKTLNVYKGKEKTNILMTDEDSYKIDDQKTMDETLDEDETDKQSIMVEESGASDIPKNSSTCPEGQEWNSTENKCVPVSTGPITQGAPTGAKGATNESNRYNSDIRSEKKRVAEYYRKLDKLEALRNLKVSDARIAAKERFLKEKKLDAMIKSARQEATPRAGLVSHASVKAGESNITKVSANEAEVTGPVGWMKDVASEKNVTPSYVWHVNKQRIFENSNQRFLKEFDAADNTKYISLAPELKATETVAGPASNDFMRSMSEQVLVLPNGKVVTPIRQFCETKVLAPGTKEAFFYDFGSVTFSDVTEDGSTQVGESSVVIRSSGGAASPRGTKLTIGYTQLEESPIDIVSAANRSYALESVNDESVEVLSRAFNDDVGSSGDSTNRKDKGGGVKTNRWVNHVGADASTDASGLGNLTFAGLVAAKGKIEDEGLDPSNLVTYTTGKAIRDLIFDPDLDSFISFSRPAIITEATVERIAGTNVVRSSACATGSQANSKRSVMFVPNIAFGLITGRDLTLEAQRRNELQVVFLTGTQRIAGFVKNIEATCRISHL